MTPGADLRIELRTRNNVLWHAIFDLYPSVAEFCRRHRFNQQDVGRLLNLAFSPYLSSGEPRPLARRLSEITGIGVSVLFPLALYDGQIPRQLSAEVTSARWLAETAHRAALAPGVDADLDAERRRAALAVALERLPARTARVLRLRFGLEADGEEQSLAAVGVAIGVSTERVRQIEAKALRMLRRPSFDRLLRPHVESIIDVQGET